MKKLFAVLFVFVLLFSCKKKDEAVIPDQTSYFPVEIGNYWIYEHFEIDAEGDETKLLKTDSVLITKDTLIDGEKYHIMESNALPDKALLNKDAIKTSAGEIINSTGVILFSETNFSDILSEHNEVSGEDTLYTIYKKMENPTYKVTVPAGTFDVLNCKGFLTLYYKNDNATTKIQKEQNTYYSASVGKILETYMYYSQPNVHYEKRLVRYKIN